MKTTHIWVLIFSIVWSLYPAVSGRAAQESAGERGLKFLQVSRSARGSAMADAAAALGGEVSSSWYNPALGGLFNGRSVEVTTIEWIGGVTHRTAEFGWGNGSRCFITGIRLISSGEIEYRSPYPTRNPIGTYGVYDGALFSTYSIRAVEHIYIGATVKYLYEKIYTESAFGYAADIGILYTLPYYGLRCGIAVRNIGQMGKLGSEKIKPPTDVIAGFTMQPEFAVRGISPIISVGYHNPLDYDPDYGLGLEIPFTDYARIRGGYVMGSDIKKLTYGLGIDVKWFTFDLALIPANYGFGNLYNFSLRVKGL